MHVFPEPTSGFRRRMLQLRGVAAMRAQLGWLHFLLQRAARGFPPAAPLARLADRRFGARSELRCEEFDRRHGTETCGRAWVHCGEQAEPGDATFGYAPINQDFFREILRAIPDDLTRLTFVDVGSGKGAGLMLASEFGFRRIVGVELNAELVGISARNAEAYRRSTGREFQPEIVQADFMAWPLPAEETLFFLNNPFPVGLSLLALRRLEEDLERRPRASLLVFRKAPGEVARHLDASPAWRPLRLAPYWRIYRNR
jgi:hypothetical protein